jgi:hypothetical protein
MSSRLTFITTNLVFGVALLSALLLKNSLLEYAVIGFVWFMLLCYLMLLISPPKNKIYVSPVPSWGMYSIDFIFLFALLISIWCHCERACCLVRCHNIRLFSLPFVSNHE